MYQVDDGDQKIVRILNGTTTINWIQESESKNKEEKKNSVRYFFKKKKNLSLY